MSLIDVINIIDMILIFTKRVLANEKNILAYPIITYEEHLENINRILDYESMILRNTIKENKDKIVEIHNNFGKIVQKHPKPSKKIILSFKKFQAKIESI